MTKAVKIYGTLLKRVGDFFEQYSKNMLTYTRGCVIIVLNKVQVIIYAERRGYKIGFEYIGNSVFA